MTLSANRCRCVGLKRCMLLIGDEAHSDVSQMEKEVVNGITRHTFRACGNHRGDFEVSVAGRVCSTPTAGEQASA